MCLKYKYIYSMRLNNPSKITRTELPSCEAIDGKKVNIAYIVIPVTKLKVGVNRRLLPSLISLKFVPNSNLILTSTCVPTSKQAPISNMEPMSKCLPTSNLVPTTSNLVPT